MREPEPADAALETFYFKPAKALFRVLETETYRKAGVPPVAPVLDLGCGDGTMAQILRRCGVLDAPPAWGLEINEADVRAAHRRGAHHAVLRGDAYRLPFAAGSFNTVIANGLFCSLPASLQPALAEARRALPPGGTLVATVPTVRARDYVWPARALARIAPGLRERMIAGFERRINHTIVLGLEGWLQAFRQAGLDPITVAPFYGPRAGIVCNLLALQPLRVFSALRAAPRRGRRLMARLLERPAHALAAADAGTDREAAGYVLIVARRR